MKQLRIMGLLACMILATTSIQGMDWLRKGLQQAKEFTEQTFGAAPWEKYQPVLVPTVINNTPHTYYIYPYGKDTKKPTSDTIKEGVNPAAFSVQAGKQYAIPYPSQYVRQILPYKERFEPGYTTPQKTEVLPKLSYAEYEYKFDIVKAPEKIVTPQEAVRQTEAQKGEEPTVEATVYAWIRIYNPSGTDQVLQFEAIMLKPGEPIPVRIQNLPKRLELFKLYTEKKVNKVKFGQWYLYQAPRGAFIGSAPFVMFTHISLGKPLMFDQKYWEIEFQPPIEKK